METMNSIDFEMLLKGQKGKYYEGRWEYYKSVIEIVKESNPITVLEIGPGSHTIVKECDIMVYPEDDAWGRPKNKVKKIIEHDATEKPWPIKDKEYDLCIALQVWEHLGNKQSRAFREVIRISKSAILSFPLNWNCPKDNANYPEHHHIDEELINDWTISKRPGRVIKIDRTGEPISKGPRIIYHWKF